MAIDSLAEEAWDAQECGGAEGVRVGRVAGAGAGGCGGGWSGGGRGR